MRTAKTDQTGRMPRLVWVFTGRTFHFVSFVLRFCHALAHISFLRDRCMCMIYSRNASNLNYFLLSLKYNTWSAKWFSSILNVTSSLLLCASINALFRSHIRLCVCSDSFVSYSLLYCNFHLNHSSSSLPELCTIVNTPNTSRIEIPFKAFMISLMKVSVCGFCTVRKCVSINRCYDLHMIITITRNAWQSCYRLLHLELNTIKKDFVVISQWCGYLCYRLRLKKLIAQYTFQQELYLNI